MLMGAVVCVWWDGRGKVHQAPLDVKLGVAAALESATLEMRAIERPVAILVEDRDLAYAADELRAAVRAGMLVGLFRASEPCERCVNWLEEMTLLWAHSRGAAATQGGQRH